MKMILRNPYTGHVEHYDSVEQAVEAHSKKKYPKAWECMRAPQRRQKDGDAFCAGGAFYTGSKPKKETP